MCQDGEFLTIKSLLQKLSFFQTEELDNNPLLKELNDMREYAKRHTCKNGIVFNQGEDLDLVFILVNCNIKIIAKNQRAGGKRRKEIILHHLKGEGILGEFEVFSPKKESIILAKIVDKNSEIYSISKKCFLRLLGLPKFTEWVITQVSNKARDLSYKLQDNSFLGDDQLAVKELFRLVMETEDFEEYGYKRLPSQRQIAMFAMVDEKYIGDLLKILTQEGVCKAEIPGRIMKKVNYINCGALMKHFSEKNEYRIFSDLVIYYIENICSKCNVLGCSFNKKNNGNFKIK